MRLTFPQMNSSRINSPATSTRFSGFSRRSTRARFISARICNARGRRGEMFGDAAALAFLRRMRYREGMPRATAGKSRQRSEEQILDQAIQQLLGATKAEAEKKGQPI